jgi:hypothetical protein
MAGVVYPLTHRMEGDYLWLRDLIGLPTFVILFAVVYFEYPYFVIDSHTDGLNHEAHEEQEVILC